MKPINLNSDNIEPNIKIKATLAPKSIYLFNDSSSSQDHLLIINPEMFARNGINEIRM